VIPQTQLRCPACGRWLAEVCDYARVVCSGCGAEVTYKSRRERRRTVTELAAAPPRMLETGSGP
jgi:predicted RNA-binding Zn-ribbon protein involved in translation (DUF1610 family)